MWQRFSESARRVIFFAQEEAGRAGENYVSTEHLLLGLIKDQRSVAVRVLATCDVSREQVREATERVLVQGKGRTAKEQLLTPQSKDVIAFTYDEAAARGERSIGSEHLLLGLLREEKGVAAQVLAELGVTLEKARLGLDELAS